MHPQMLNASDIQRKLNQHTLTLSLAGLFEWHVLNNLCTKWCTVIHMSAAALVVSLLLDVFIL